MVDLKKSIRDIVDYPVKGIVFKDITTLLSDSMAFKASIDQFMEAIKGKRITKVAGIESRGFMFGAAIADRLNVGFVPIRKAGKLPYKTHREEYSLEYGTDCLEAHIDAFHYTDHVLLVDDLLATGGTARASANLIRKCGANITSIAFLIELSFLNGRVKLPNTDIISLIKYDSE
jgi:adenine phosphoribosyltransferase